MRVGVFYASVCVRRCCWYVCTVCTAVWVDECQLLCYSLVLHYLLCLQFAHCIISMFCFH